MKTFKDLLKELNACNPAIIWAENMTIEDVVEKCHRGDWLLWLAKKVDIDFQLLTLAKGYCAKTVYNLMTDERSRNAVDIAIAFGEGKATIEELNAAAAAAYAAYTAATGAATAYAADAAADAAYTAADAAYAAAAYAAYTAATGAAAAYAADAAATGAAAAYAADAAAYTAAAAYAAYAAYTAARTKNRLETADICRKYIGQEIIEKVNLLLQK